MNVFLKLDTAWYLSPWLVVLSAGSRLSWVMLLGYVKTTGRGGVAKRIDPLSASRMWFVGEEDVRQMESAAVQDGALTIEGGQWILANWRKYQTDETGAERQARFRQERKSNGSNALRNGVTVEQSRADKSIVDTPPTPQVAICPQRVSPELWAEWIAFRKRKKWSIDPISCLPRMVKRLDAMSDPSAAIEQSLTNGWQSLHEPKPDGFNPDEQRKRTQRIAEEMGIS